MDKRLENGLTFIAVVALVATFGSLYFSEVRGFIPCTLCWYQRIFMYPIVIIAAVGLIQKNANTALTTAIFSVIGGSLSLYHYGIQKITFLQDSAPSCGTVSCTGAYVNYFGFITIPLLAFIAFTLIAITSIVMLKWQKERN